MAEIIHSGDKILALKTYNQELFYLGKKLILVYWSKT